MTSAVTIIILLGLVTLTLAYTECGPLQAVKVKQQWYTVYASKKQHLNQWIDFHKVLIKTVNAQNPVFRKVALMGFPDRDTRKAAFVRGMANLDSYFSLLDQPAILRDCVKYASDQNAKYNIDPKLTVEWHKAWKRAVLQVVPAYLTRGFDLEAWDACYNLITGEFN